MIDYLQAMWQLAMARQVQGVVFWCLLYSFIMLGSSALYQLRTRHWPSVVGTLDELGTREFGGSELVRSEQEYQAGARYRYEVAGKQYLGTRVSLWTIIASHNLRGLLDRQLAGVERLPDGGVRVFYSPVRPSRSVLIIASRASIALTMLAATLPLLLYWLHYHG
ncbi:DUF3592 domain-containing protein [Chitinibacteraceae bacterium HSL-7]